MVWDFRHLNSYCREMTTRFETLSAVRHLAQQGDWMISCDLEDGYHAVGIHNSHQRYMTASLNGKLYSCASLPFGWSGEKNHNAYGGMVNAECYENPNSDFVMAHQRSRGVEVLAEV